MPSAPVLLAGGHGLLVGVLLKNSETVEGTPERAPLAVVLPDPYLYP